MDPAETANLGIPFGAGLDGNARRLQLGHDRVEVVDAEIDEPLLFGRAEVFGVQRERRNDRWPLLLPPHG